jgi:hypothetical protein
LNLYFCNVFLLIFRLLNYFFWGGGLKAFVKWFWVKISWKMIFLAKNPPPHDFLVTIVVVGCLTCCICFFIKQRTTCRSPLKKEKKRKKICFQGSVGLPQTCMHDLFFILWFFFFQVHPSTLDYYWIILLVLFFFNLSFIIGLILNWSSWFVLVCFF